MVIDLSEIAASISSVDFPRRSTWEVAWWEGLAARDPSTWSIAELRAVARVLVDREDDHAQLRELLDVGGQPVFVGDGSRRLRLLATDREPSIRRWFPPASFVVELAMPYDPVVTPEIVEVVRALPGRHYDARNVRWLIPCSARAFDQLLAISLAYGFQFPDADQDWSRFAELVADERSNRILSQAVASDFPIDGLPDGLTLYPFQRAGVEFAVKNRSVLIADEMGLGKTVQALCSLHVLNAFPALVVCPASLKENWRREVQRWLPRRSVSVLSSREGRPDAEVVVINYDVLLRRVDDLLPIPWSAFVMDEGHKLKNPKALRTRAMKVLLKSHQQASRIMLTGTPIINNPMEFGALAGILGRLRHYGGPSSFERRYRYAHRALAQEMAEIARSHFMIRRAKRDVLTELPAKTRVVVPVELDNRADYLRAEADLAAYLAERASLLADTGRVVAEAIDEALRRGLDGDELAAFVRQREERARGHAYVAKHAAVSRAEALVRWSALKHLTARGKLRAFRSWLDDALESGEKFLIFGWHRDILDQIAGWYGWDVISGSTPSHRRQAMVDRFQRDPSVLGLVGSMPAMGEGLTLTASSRVVFVEYGWSPKDHLQAEDRAHRIGQRHNVTVYHVVAMETIEDALETMLRRKLEIVSAFGVDDSWELFWEATSSLRLGRK